MQTLFFYSVGRAANSLSDFFCQDSTPPITHVTVTCHHSAAKLKSCEYLLGTSLPSLGLHLQSLKD